MNWNCNESQTILIGHKLLVLVNSNINTKTTSLILEKMSAMKLGPPHPPVPPIPSTTPAMLVNWSGDAMDTLKLKIGLLKRENVDSSLKMEEAEKVHLKYI